MYDGCRHHVRDGLLIAFAHLHNLPLSHTLDVEVIAANCAKFVNWNACCFEMCLNIFSLGSLHADDYTTLVLAK